MAKPKRITCQQMIDEIHAKSGVLTLVAESLDCSLQNIYYYRKKFRTVELAIEEARDTYDATLLDEAETKLLQAIREGKSWAVKYTLNNKGGSRGYGKHVAPDVDVDFEFTVNITD